MPGIVLTNISCLRRISRCLLALLLLCGSTLVTHSAAAQQRGNAAGSSSAASGAADGSATMGDMASPMTGHMAAHMQFTALRSIEPGDQARADAMVAAARQAMAPYKDYQKALDDGYEIFMPNMKGQKIYHFTNYANAAIARRRFDPLRPTSLLYEKTGDGGYRLVGAMYTDRRDASLSELNQRIPLSIARWHQHVNFCQAPAGEKAEYFGKYAKFGFMGSISTEQACQAAGGTFHPHIFGWMVHVYPYETDPKKIWAIEAPAAEGVLSHVSEARHGAPAPGNSTMPVGGATATPAH